MGAAARMAARFNLLNCSDCRKPFEEGRRIGSFCDDPLEAVCEWCDLMRAYLRVHRRSRPAWGHHPYGDGEPESDPGFGAGSPMLSR